MHGSENIIKKPTFGHGKKYNDYGLGFYCTENEELANEWAVDIDRNGYCNIYDLNIKNLKILNLNDQKYSILTWLAILTANRTFDLTAPIAIEAYNYIFDNFTIDYSKYDIIKGYRADDSYFQYAEDFLNNLISLRQLSEAMYLGNLGEQIVLKSKKAFNNIHFLDARKVDKDIWYPKKEMRDRKARKDYYDIEKYKRKKDDIFVLQIINGEYKGL